MIRRRQRVRITDWLAVMLSWRGIGFFELIRHPDAWPKFEKLIKSAAKMGHKPHRDDPDRKRPLSESKRNAAAVTSGNSYGDIKN